MSHRGRGNARGSSGGGGYRGNQQRGSTRHCNAPRGRPHFQQIGYRLLTEWEHFEGPDLIVRIFERYKEFKTLLNSDVTREKDIFTVLIYVLNKACDTTTQVQKKHDLLDMVKGSEYFKDRLVSFIREMAEEDARAITDGYPKLLSHILALCSHILHTLRTPTVIPVADLNEALCLLEERSIVTKEEHQYIFDSYEKLSKDRKNMMREASATRRGDNSKDTKAPAGSYRDMSVIPGIKDLTEAPPSLRCNIVQGPYKDNEQYLDIIFRLHREDLVIPLRQSIQCFRSSTFGKQLAQKEMALRYSNVRIDPTPQIIDQEVIYKLHFGKKGLDHVVWETTRRLMYGCLLCLSCDNFTSILMATVASRKTHMLEEGKVQVRFENISQDDINARVKDNKQYTMIESAAYYEAYKHVLSRIKEIRGDIPFRKYLVKVQKKLDLPGYISQCHSPADIKYNLSCLLREQVGQCDINVLRCEEWPMSDDMKLDPSQRKAVQHALQSDLAIIQGPPGTGKTYIGLMIVKVLLDNAHAWRSEDNKRPILIITYTNHALDQFLEGVMKFTSNIVRVGSRSRSEILEHTNLNYILSTYKIESEDGKARHNLSKDIAIKRLGCTRNLDKIHEKLQSLGKENIVHENELGDIIKPYHFKTLKDGWIRDEKQSLLFRWLTTQRANLCTGNYMPHYDTLLNHVVDVSSLNYADHTNDNLNGIAGNDMNAYYEDYLQKDIGESRMSEIQNVRDESIGVNFDPGETVPMKLCQEGDTSHYSSERGQHSLSKNVIDRFPSAHTDRTSLPRAVHTFQTQNAIAAGKQFKSLDFINQHLVDGHDINLIEHSTPSGLDEENERYEIEESRYILPCDDLYTDGVFDSEEEGELDYFAMIRRNKSMPLTAQLNAQYARENADVDLLLLIIRGQLERVDKMSDQEEDQISEENLWALNEDQRWRLYRLWISRYIENLQERKDKLLKEYDGLQKIKAETDTLKKREVLKNASVIGMTTTGGAKMIDILREVKSPIVVFEEAAEVLEGHSLANLTEHCQHLIMIGDQQQLQPKPTVYSLGKKFNLDVSLFERMIRNKVPYIQLQVQHRMRPEISVVLKHIYKSNIYDHTSVEHFENIKGVARNMFFISHTKTESKRDSEIKSPANEHEAKFLVRFADYLIKQDYHPGQITILTMYSGQVKCIKSHLEERNIDPSYLQVRTVDNFQGQENDIILLSLVRSNVKGVIGFLDVDNRVCVSLTRARKGLYCIGNLSQMKSNNLWKEVIEDMEKQKRVGCQLELKCQKHSQSIHVSDESDFDDLSSGGCKMTCDATMGCGHTCPSRCHPGNHPFCVQPCKKVICSRKHLCQDNCGDMCSTFCHVLGMITIPSCGHTIHGLCEDIPTDTSKMKCTLPCQKTFPCGHKCQLRCGDPCDNTHCEVPVHLTRPCGHINSIPCNEKHRSALCTDPCSAQLPCGHHCTGMCGTCTDGTHRTCSEKCERALPCGDKCQDECGDVCKPCDDPCRNRCVHKKCKRQCGQECERCIQNCEWLCEHSRCSKICWELCDKTSCNLPCKKRLKCGHACIGLCGEKCPSKCVVCQPGFFKRHWRKVHNLHFIELNDCGHIFEVQTFDEYMYEASNIRKVCPIKWCRTLITNSFRYGNVIKRGLIALEEEKRSLRKKRKNSASSVTFPFSWQF